MKIYNLCIINNIATIYTLLDKVKKFLWVIAPNPIMMKNNLSL